MTEWLEGVKKGVQANTMALYMLCALTDTNIVVHLSNGKYLRDEPTEHNVYLERCHTHLCYMEMESSQNLNLDLSHTNLRYIRN